MRVPHSAWVVLAVLVLGLHALALSRWLGWWSVPINFGVSYLEGRCFWFWWFSVLERGPR